MEIKNNIENHFLIESRMNKTILLIKMAILAILAFMSSQLNVLNFYESLLVLYSTHVVLCIYPWYRSI